MSMKLDDLKPLGAFAENTIRPILENSDDLLKRFEKININPKTIYKILTFHYIIYYTLDFIKTLSVTAMIVYGLCTIYQ